MVSPPFRWKKFNFFSFKYIEEKTSLRKRQTPPNPNTTSGRQKTADVNLAKSNISGLNNIPANYFDPATIGQGLFGTGLLNARINHPVEYVQETTNKGNPLLKTQQTYSYFFVTYNNTNIIGLAGFLKAFSVVETLSPTTVNSVSQMLGNNIASIIGITKDQYDANSFAHPFYSNESGDPLQIRYAEIAIVKQITSGRLDNIPVGYPDFDSTPDGVITRKGPLPSPPYTDFSTATGATSISILVGGSVDFKDTTPNTPWQIAPLYWEWDFGATADPSDAAGATAQNPTVTYGSTGTYSVTLTTSNAAGSTIKTRVNFVTVK